MHQLTLVRGRVEQLVRQRWNRLSASNACCRSDTSARRRLRSRTDPGRTDVDCTARLYAELQGSMSGC